MENNWIDLFATCAILFMFLLLFVAATFMMQQVNIWRNERSMHKRLDIRHKREMEARITDNLKIVEIAVKPIVLTYESEYSKKFLEKCLEDEFYKNRLYSSIIEHHLSSVLIENTDFKISETIFERNGEQSQSLTAKLAIIPKEHIKLFDKS